MELIAQLEHVPAASLTAILIVAAAGLLMGVAPSSLPMYSVVVGSVAARTTQSFKARRGLLFAIGFVLAPALVRLFAEEFGDVPGKLDIVQVHPGQDVDFVELAHAAADRGARAFWIEEGAAAAREIEEILGNGRVQLVEHESLEAEYLKHLPFALTQATGPRRESKATRVKERMPRNPATVRPDDGLKDAIWKMERGHFRHLPVVNEKEKLIGMLTDRDIRLIRLSLAFMKKEEAEVQLWSIAVQQAAVFDPVQVKPETSLKEAADLMLRWHVGGLPVVDESDRLVGIITYTDVLREFVGREGN